MTRCHLLALTPWRPIGRGDFVLFQAAAILLVHAARLVEVADPETVRPATTAAGFPAG